MSESFDFDRDVLAFLAICRTAGLATVGDDGRPHAANVQYAHDSAYRLYFVSHPDSAHSRHIARQPCVAVTIYAHNDRPELIHGLQVHGRCEAVEDREQWNYVWELYTEKFSFIKALPQMRQRVEAQQFYRITPTWLRWIDNRRSFGWKTERQIPEASCPSLP